MTNIYFKRLVGFNPLEFTERNNHIFNKYVKGDRKKISIATNIIHKKIHIHFIIGLSSVAAPFAQNVQSTKIILLPPKCEIIFVTL